ncbi:MAG: LacI family DNA-binding transcriptional regulator [Spirochaetia bacterium]|nr:LacI family DNA-binding transcriptional regulator [Spirochaetia bacterium]
MNPQPPSLVDVAREALVSTMTASRVLSGKSLVAEPTRQRVMEAVQKLGYLSDVFASSNAKKRSAKKIGADIAVVARLSQLMDPLPFAFYSTIYFALQASLQRRRFHVHFFDVENDGEAFVSGFAPCEAVVVFGDPTPEAGEWIKRTSGERPLVNVAGTLEAEIRINPDTAEGGRLAAEYLAGLGHRRVAVLAEADSKSHTHERFQSFRSRFSAAEYTVDLVAFQPQPLTADTDQNILTSWRNYVSKTPTLPTAVFCANGYSTFVLYHELRRSGLRIPEDIGLLGYDALSFYDHLETPLSRIDFDVAALGELAGDAAFERLQNGRPQPRKILVPARLVKKSSVLPISDMPGVR